jgi:Calcineurin-like phosphoesterase
LNRPQTEESRRSIEPAYHGVTAKLQHFQIVGLYSNSAENPGFISGPVPGQKQKQWLVQTLKSLKATRDSGSRKALLFATHHPPYSSGGHSGSTEMLDDIDDACKQADIMPDAFFSGHAHEKCRR